MRRAASIAAAALVLAGSGCVQQDRYDNTVMSARSLKEQLVAAERDRDAARANLEQSKRQLAEARASNEELHAHVTTLDAEFKTQSEKYDELLRRISELDFGPLPLELEQALETLAAQYPEVLSFDSRHGMLEFSSDFTFDPGSVELKPEAAATLATLGDILNATEASAFEVRVIGHTDNVPVQKPSTLRLHPTNLHLSVHRAISVRDALVQAGVDPVRIQVAGYGDTRPVVPNGPKGAAANRRVEMVLVPMQVASAPPQPATEPAPVSEPVPVK